MLIKGGGKDFKNNKLSIPEILLLLPSLKKLT
jgi:hypothetical protein